MTTGQVTKNCHYISRSLTRPWETGQRRLRFYDFDTTRWVEGSSYSMFAADGLNPQAVESWLDRWIEGPLSLCRKRLNDGEENVLEDWGFYRAATLMLWLQGTRLKSIEDTDSRRSLETLAARSIEETDQLVLAFREEYDLALGFVPMQEGMFPPLYFPSSGLFPVSYRDTGCISGNTIALALPLDVRTALLSLPRDQAGVRDLARVPGSLQNLSIGVANARRVVVPPVLLEQETEVNIGRILKDQRVRNVELLELVKETKRLVANAFDETGIEAPRDTVGRFPPRRST